MTIRSIQQGDAAAMNIFGRSLPVEETTFLKGDAMDNDSVPAGSLRLVAIGEDSAIEGYASVYPGVGMSSHVGDVRLIVAPAARGRGVGLGLARRAMVESFSSLGLSKLSVEVVADEQGTIRMFRKLGFSAEALLRDHLCDSSGKMRDLVMLCHLASDGMADFSVLGRSASV
jgi:RimJ/RimL family protein N-acetyltransferase